MKSKAFSTILILLFLGIVGAIIGGIAWWTTSTSAPDTSEEKIRFVIKKGASAESIGNNLKENALIKSKFAFKLYIQKEGIAQKIPPGEFNIPQNLKLSEVIDLLLEGPSELWATIPEGLRREEIAEIIIETLDLTNPSTFKSEFLSLTTGFEGKLFPDTYLFPPDITAQKVVNVLTTTFENKFGDVDKTTLILASLLERETITDEERPIVAGILLKRFQNNWPLQIDATVQYVIGKSGNWWPRPLTKAHLAIDSPYNTYKYPGFPPAPISNPGLSSLKAAANPESSPYWFYIHDNSGQIHYGKTIEEHNQNIARYLK